MVSSEPSITEYTTHKNGIVRSNAILFTNRQHGLYANFDSKLSSNILNFLSEGFKF